MTYRDAVTARLALIDARIAETARGIRITGYRILDALTEQRCEAARCWCAHEHQLAEDLMLLYRLSDRLADKLELIQS